MFSEQELDHPLAIKDVYVKTRTHQVYLGLKIINCDIFAEIQPTFECTKIVDLIHIVI